MSRTRFPFAILSILCSTVSLFAFQANPSEPDRQEVLLQAARNSAQAGNLELAISRFQGYLTLQPANGEAALELAGLLTRSDRREEAENICVEAITHLTKLHQAEPNNPTVLYQLARLSSMSMSYDQAAHWYELYLELKPEDQEARLQQARLDGWDLRYADAELHYRKMVDDFPEELGFKLEWQAKHHNWLGRSRLASAYYEQASALNPEDVELLFDLAQTYSRRNLSRRAQQLYDQILELAPEHYMADRANLAEQWRCRQHLRIEQSFLRKKGRGFEVDITQLRTDLWYAPQRIAEGLDFSVGAGQSFFFFDLKPQIDKSPSRLLRILNLAKLSDASTVVGFLNQLHDRRRLRRYDPHSPATHLMVKFDKHFDSGVRAWADIELTAYDQRQHQTMQFDSGINYRIEDQLELALIGGKEDVLENFATLDGSLSRYYLGGRFDWQPIRHCGASGQVRGYWYDDGNRAVDYSLEAFCILSTYPRILKLVGKYYGYHVADDRSDYWTPRDYWNTQVGLSWHHYLNKWHFQGAEKFYYYLEGFAGLDGQGEPSLQGKAGLIWDSQHRWKVGMEASATYSDVYEEQRGMIYLKYTW